MSCGQHRSASSGEKIAIIGIGGAGIALAPEVQEILFRAYELGNRVPVTADVLRAALTETQSDSNLEFLHPENPLRHTRLQSPESRW